MMEQEARITKTYVLFPSLSKSLRNILTLGVLIIGFSIQLNVSAIIGSSFIIFASLLNILHFASIKSKVPVKENWERVTYEEFNKVITRIQGIKKWQGFSTGGRITFVVIVTFICIVFFIPLLAMLSRLGVLILIDFLILFVPLFISGSKSAWIPKDLEVKINTLTKINNFDFIKAYQDLKIQPYLLVGKEAKETNFPMDTRLMIEFSKAPKDFIGVQIQVSINNVKSTPYPYAYAVVLAKKSMELGIEKKSSADKNILFEHQVKDDMDILVIRQFTTRTSGYHTNDKTIADIVSQAIATSLQLLYAKTKVAQ